MSAKPGFHKSLVGLRLRALAWDAVPGGWRVLGVAALGIFISGSSSAQSIAVFIRHFEAILGIGSYRMSLIYSAATLLASLPLPFLGYAVDRVGRSRALVGTVAGLSLGALGLALARNGPTLLIAIFLVRLFGIGGVSIAAYSIVPQWFPHGDGRSKALSVVVLASWLGTAVMPEVDHALATGVGWSAPWFLWSGLSGLLFVPVAAVLVREPQRPSGRRAPLNDIQAADETQFAVRRAMRTGAFWALLLCVFALPLVSGGIALNLFTMFARHHLDGSVGALALSVYSLSALAATYPTGALVGRIGLRASLIGGLALYLLQIVILMQAHSPLAAMVFATCWGIGQGIVTVAVQTAWPALYGSHFLGAINGIASGVVMLGSALGPVPFGWAFAHFHGYHQVLWSMMALLIVTLVAALTIRPPSSAARREPQSSSGEPDRR